MLFQFLAHYFGYTSRADNTKLMESTFPSLCFPTVPLARISQTLDMLVGRGFTKEQIRWKGPFILNPDTGHYDFNNGQKARYCGPGLDIRLL